MSLQYKLKHYFWQKIYHAVKIIEKERIAEENRLRQSTIKKLGKNSSFDNIEFFSGGAFMTIGDNFFCKEGGWIECIDHLRNQEFHPSLIIGNNFSMQRFCHIGCVESVQIGNDVLLGSKVYISDHNHGDTSSNWIDLPPNRRPLCGKPIKIGDNVWIGDNVCILPGVILGNNVIVGANAVVTHSFPDNSVIAGCPAKLIKVIE